MIYLLLAIFSSAMVSIVMRYSEKYIHYHLGMLAMNYVICTCVALTYTKHISFQGAGHTFTLILGIISGAFYLLSFMLLQYSIQHNGVVLSSLYAKLGIIVPIVMSILFFHEQPTFLQISGFVIAVISIIYMNVQKDTAFHLNYSLLILLFIGGSCDSFSKIFEQIGNQRYSDQFLFYTFLFALIICFMIMIIKKQKIQKEEIFFGIAIGIPNYFSARFLLLSLKSIPAVITYPTYSIATIIFVSLFGIFVFHEHMDRKKYIAMLGIFIALLLLNI